MINYHDETTNTVINLLRINCVAELKQDYPDKDVYKVYTNQGADFAIDKKLSTLRDSFNKVMDCFVELQSECGEVTYLVNLMNVADFIHIEDQIYALTFTESKIGKASVVANKEEAKKVADFIVNRDKTPILTV